MPFVEIYTKATCGYCWRATTLLRDKGIEFQEIPIDFGGPDRQTMIERAYGRTTVPQIFFDGVHVGGCDSLFALERSGRLDGMIAG